MKNHILLIALVVVNFTISSAQHTHDHSHDQPENQSHEAPHDHDHEAGHESHSHTHESDNQDHQHGPEIHSLETLQITPTTYLYTIQATGTVKITPTNEKTVIAKTKGIVTFANENIVPGKKLSEGDPLFTISGEDMAESNLRVRFVTAKNRFKESKLAFERARSLVDEKILTRQEFIARQSQYERDSLKYHILKENYHTSRLSVASPLAGELFDIFVRNGEYVTTGQKLATISKNCHSYLQVDLPKKYYHKIDRITGGNYKMEYSDHAHSFSEKAKLAQGSRLRPGTPFVPINFSLGHAHHLVPGSFAEVWLNIDQIENAIVVPKSALIEQQGAYFVFVKKGPEDYLKTPVAIQSMNLYEAQIASGLQIGDEVVIHGVLELKLSQSGSAVDPHAGHNH